MNSLQDQYNEYLSECQDEQIKPVSFREFMIMLLMEGIEMEN